MVRVTSNRKSVVSQIDKKIQKTIIESGAAFERILQEELRAPKSGRIYGEEEDVVFNVRRKGGLQRVKFVANKGRQFREGKRNAGMHRASAPGEAPAIETGALRKGITRTVTHVGPMKWAMQIGVSLQSGRGGPTGSSARSIAHMLEFGTTRIKARPGWRLALEKFKAGYRSKVAEKKSKG